MANGNASLAAARVATPQVLVRGNQQDGEARVFVSTYTVPATLGPVVGENISWGFLPMGARLIPGSRLYFSAGAASSTLNLGDPAAPARYLPATAVTTAGNALADAHLAGGALAEVDVVAVGLVTDKSELRSVVAGAALQVGQVITLFALYAANN